jgi:hypothetical protein
MTRVIQSGFAKIRANKPTREKLIVFGFILGVIPLVYSTFAHAEIAKYCPDTKPMQRFDIKKGCKSELIDVDIPSISTRSAKSAKPSRNEKAPEGNISNPTKILAADPQPPISKACSEGFSTHLVVGDSFNDINFLNTANCNPAQAKGAQFSWARNGVAQNTQWLAKGAVAAELLWISPSPSEEPIGPYLNYFAIAPEISFQRVVNSNAKLAATQNIDVLSYGFSGEALYGGVKDLQNKTWQVYLRARANINGSFSGGTHSWSTTFEVEPLSDYYSIGSNIPVGIGYFFVLPLLRAQYFQRESNSTDAIFSRGNEVFRLGPAISFNLIPQDTRIVDPNKPAPATQWILNLTYSWYRDLLHGAEFQHWNPSFTYNFTDNLALSIGYEKGKIEATGKSIDLATVSLTVKN